MPSSPDNEGRRAAHAPYADALDRVAARDSLFLTTPGHGRNDEGIAHGLADYFGERILSLDVPPLFDGIDLGVDTPKDEALELAAEAWGARRTWFLTNGSSQGNRMAALAVGTLGTGVVTQRSAHSSFIDGIVLAGLNPRFVSPNVDEANGIAHGVTPDALRHAIRMHPEKVTAVYLVTPSYFGAVADVAALAEVAHEAGAMLIIDAAWGAHFGFHRSPCLARHARGRHGHHEHAQARRFVHAVGAAPPRRHRVRRPARAGTGPRLHDDVLDE